MSPEFKKPLKLSLITFAVGIVLTIIASTWVFNQKISDRKKKERASLIGGGLGVGMVLVVAPFWLMAAARIGKEKRERRAAEKGQV